MSIKKIIALGCLAFITSTAYCADFTSLSENEELSNVIESKIEAAAQKQSYKFNYYPVVFKVTTTFQRNIFERQEDYDGRTIRINLNYKQDGLWGEGAGIFKANCYGTLINKDYLLTHTNCLYQDELPYLGDDAPGAMVDFDPLYTDISLNGRVLSFDLNKLNNVFVDYKSDAVLIDLRSLCLKDKATKSDNVCVRVWEWLSNSEKVTFNLKDNYGTVILSNMEPTDKVEDAFLKRTFFSPISGGKTVSSVKGGYLTVFGKAEKSYAGEPLFHRASGNTNILVGIKTLSDENIISNTKSNKYALFSSDFTKMVKKNIKGGGIKLTKDLNANTNL